MTYDFKRLEEMAWVGFVAAAVFGLEMLVRFDVDRVDDWQAYALALGSGMLRAAVGAIIAFRTRP